MLNIKKEKKVMTDEDMLNQVKVLNMMFGGEVKTVNPTIQKQAFGTLLILTLLPYQVIWKQVSVKYKDIFQFVGYEEDYKKFKRNKNTG